MSRRYESWCCQRCGLEVGWLGLFIDWWFGCAWRRNCPPYHAMVERRERAQLARLLRKYGAP